jgi:hypothetical protein
MSKPGVLLYRCRLCSEVIEGAHAPDATLALFVVQGLSLMPEAWQQTGGEAFITGWITHRCSGGGGRQLAVADFIGVKEDAGRGEG